MVDLPLGTTCRKRCFAGARGAITHDEGSGTSPRRTVTNNPWKTNRRGRLLAASPRSDGRKRCGRRVEAAPGRGGVWRPCFGARPRHLCIFSVDLVTRHATTRASAYLGILVGVGSRRCALYGRDNCKIRQATDCDGGERRFGRSLGREETIEQPRIHKGPNADTASTSMIDR